MAAEGQAIRVSSQSYGAVDQMSHASAEGYFGAIVPDDITSGEEPSAPPAYPMDDVSGYEGTALGDGGGKGLPPPSDLVTDRGGGPPPAQTDWNIPAVSEDAAKEALIQYAASKCCYSSAPAKEMVFRTLQPFDTYRYRLETFTEFRSSEWKTTPYKEMHRRNKQLAKRAAIIVDVQVQFAAGSVMEEERKNNIFEYVADQRAGFPADLFKEVYPVVNFPDPSISQASQNALVQHHTQFASTSRVLRQRQTIELIPLTKVEYEWQGKRYSYYVYGDENRVYAENYPKKCCCSIM
ncbi:coiled-coil domain-containing protein 159 [Platysternon megacephalum]|uniref:Coiled-coil domain-containing protein 159 n=1 Tax=Platysternon megacephalum TaxID=55544 RepID=A0A4D9DX83_9SAUR|nr:coiled-coil domain-containing protein 159 [Platysternon megacephalum]